MAFLSCTWLGTERAFVFHKVGKGYKKNNYSIRKSSSAVLKTSCCVQFSDHQKEYTAALVIPTGTGARIGGYAGDGLPTARAFASVVDRLIAHPNVLNGALMYWPMDNVLYVEGFGMDQFFSGKWGLRPVRWNRVGLVLDSGIEEELLYRHLQCADAARATLGIAVTDYALTEKALHVETFITDDGTSSGRIEGLELLVRASRKLIEERNCDAIALVTRFPDDDDELLHSYRHGYGVDIVGGAEALISRHVAQECQVPCAHAPALSPLPLDKTIHPKSAAEELGYTFLTSVLVGLSRAPHYITSRQDSHAEDIWVDSLDAVVLPFGVHQNTCAVEQLYHSRTALFYVEENSTEKKDIPIPSDNRLIKTSNYLEALGFIAAHKAGVLWDAMRPQISSIRRCP
ncbi:uncharacterized protein Gasu_21940 [Galdieria sulphuraria]|uniref:DUF3326 domain-containing protein n=1 Tax=Galdieria sulphuraria TaxID=130081 RepID=M2XK58_GALSU|nr:uncharacterized protein Gasu_21940 [Galdieria sulphuraria]EME30522.1 hypothetical protein Gasu_21940 [Galdieria sulphuraria]|eukprot:XP_005707042.1 hypothetical protein Gasu_21940 [Galdieria sulphuraria]